MHPAERGAQIRLQHLVPERRQALLLTALEGFSLAEVASIIGSTPDRARELISAAMDEIARGIATDVLIIEDEPIIGLDLSHIVEELGHRVIRLATTRNEAVAAVRVDRPGLTAGATHPHQAAGESAGLRRQPGRDLVGLPRGELVQGWAEVEEVEHATDESPADGVPRHDAKQRLARG